MLLRTPRLLLAISPALLAACANTAPAPTSAAQGPFLRGTATVVSIEPTLGRVVLNYQGRQVQAYWQTELSGAQGGSTMRPDVNKPPVGIYREADLRAQTFDAAPGDTIAFIGMQTGSSIFLQGIAVLGH